MVKTKEHGYTPTAKTVSSFDTQLLEACKAGKIERVQLLLEMGASPNAIDPAYGLSALTVACIIRGDGDDARAKILELLLSHGAQIGAPDDRGRTALHHAAMLAPQVRVFTSLLNVTSQSQNKISSNRGMAHIVNKQDREGNTALHVLCSSHAQAPLAVAQTLLRHGADPNVRNKRQRTPLLCAAVDANVPLLEVLLSHGAFPNAQDISKWTALTLTCYSYRHDRRDGFCDAVALLLRYGANPNLATTESTTPLFYSIKNKATRITDVLLQHTNTLNCRDSAGRSILHWVYNKWDQYPNWLDEKLLNNGADPNARDDEGHVPIYYALQRLRMLRYADDFVPYFPSNNLLLPSVLLNIQAGLNPKFLPRNILTILLEICVFSEYTKMLDVLKRCGIHYVKDSDSKSGIKTVNMVNRVTDLQDLALNSIRYSLRPNAIKHIDQLPLPSLLRQKVIMADIVQSDS